MANPTTPGTDETASSDAAEDPKPISKEAASDDLDEVHLEAMKRADEAWLFEIDNIYQGREDQRFYAGDQWPPEAIKARGLDRPMLTINRIPTFVRQLTGDIRQNTPAIKVLPAGGEATQEIAEINNGLIRNIEANSMATAAYVKAVENAAQAGQGAFRIITEYSDDTGFEQEIKIRPINDPFGVLVDPLAQLPDKADMKYAFVFERFSLEGFKAAYPDATPDDMPNNYAAGTATTVTFTWRTGDSVRVAEYWVKKPEKKTIYQLEDGSIVEEIPTGATPKATRVVETDRVVSYLISGTEVLSGPHEWPSKYIPICFVAGEETNIDGATKRRGMVRDMKDSQRLYNYARTAAAESIALQPKAPYLVTVDDIKGYEDIWATAGSQNHPYLPYNRDPRAPNSKPERSQPAMAQQGLDSQAMLAGNELEAVSGIFKANLGAPSNETSGRAILSRQKEGDTGTFLYVYNLRVALTYAGKCLLDLFPHVYDSERVVRVLKEDGSPEMKTVNQVVPNDDPERDMLDVDAQWKVLNDLSVGKYDVVVSTGPSFLTRRQEMADSLVNLTQNMPIIGKVAPDLVVKALDFPGGEEIAARLERTIPPNVMSEEPLPPPPPPPELVAKTMKDAAQAKLYLAQAGETEVKAVGEGVSIIQMLQTMHMDMMGIKQQVDALGAPPGSAPPAPQPIQIPQGPQPQLAPSIPPLNPLQGMGEMEPIPQNPTQPNGAA